MLNTELIADFKTALEQAHQIVFLTGAGVSTASGIPDYRSKTGIYSGQQNPEYLLSAENLRDNPQSFYDFVMQKMFFPEAQPNLIHEKIAAITNKKGTLITQNVDGLDTKAGNQHVIEFHGNLYNLYCQKCQQKFTYTEYAQSMIHEADGGIIRPDITLYSEQINFGRLEQSVQALEMADLVVIVGTSFRVYPFAQLLSYKPDSAPVWVINQESISNDAQVHEIVGDAVEVFVQI